MEVKKRNTEEEGDVSNNQKKNSRHTGHRCLVNRRNPFGQAEPVDFSQMIRWNQSRPVAKEEGVINQ